MPRHRYKTSRPPYNGTWQSFPRDALPTTGRGRRDWRRNLYDDQMGCFVGAMTALPVIWFFGYLFGFW